MSRLQQKDFFTVPIEFLKVDEVLPFDCYLNLGGLQKILIWIQRGKRFTQAHLDKMNSISNTVFLIPKDQEPDFTKYLERFKPREDTLSYQKFKEQNPQLFGQPKAAAHPAEDKSPTKPPEAAPSAAPAVAPAASKVATPPRARNAKLDAAFLNPFIQATQRAFAEFCNAPVRSRPPMSRVVKTDDPLQIEVATLISLVSDSIRGNIGLCFPQNTFLFIMSRMSGRPVSRITNDLVLGAGELIYYIFESARKPLSDLGYPLERAVPTLVFGSGLAPRDLITDPGFTIMFESQGGMFQFEVGIKTGT